MAITVRCECGARFQVRDEYAGKKGQCPTCGTVVRIPGAGEEPELSLDDDPVPGEFEEPEDDDYDPPPRPRRRRQRNPEDAWFGRGFLGLTRKSSGLFLLIGLLLVIFSRGCDSTAMRSVSSIAAAYQLAQNNFNDEWEKRRKGREDEIKRLRERQTELRAGGKADEANALDDQIDDEQKKITKLREDQQKERQRLEETTWRDYQLDMRDARHKTVKWRWWLAWMFLLGTLVLAFGLIAMSITGQGAERTISLIMISIITFSIYIGGFAWIDTIYANMESLVRPVRVIR